MGVWCIKIEYKWKNLVEINEKGKKKIQSENELDFKLFERNTDPTENEIQIITKVNKKNAFANAKILGGK